MKTIYLIRHSAPFVDILNYKDFENTVLWDEFNKNMILSVEGEENAKKLCDVPSLKSLDAVYASNSARAIGTAKYISEVSNIPLMLDDRINERSFGVNYIKELPEDYSVRSFNDKNFKMENGESLNELDSRFNLFIDDILNSDYDNVALVIHGIILLSFLQNNCDFNADGKKFLIKYNDNIILDGNPKNPDIYKVEFDNKKVVNISNIEIN